MIPFKWILLFYQLFGLALGYYDTQQKIISQNGHLIFESGLDRNIVFRVSGLGRLRINNFDLLNLMINIISRSVAPSHDLARINARLGILEVQVNHLMNRSRILEVGFLNVSTAVNGEDRVQQINLRLEALEHRIDTIFMKLNEDNCRSVPCQNGGTCIDGYDTFQCKCSSNWQGRTCSEDVNECANFADTGLGCQNRANCINTPGSYICQCRDNFRGMHCTQKIKDCNSASSFELCGHGFCVTSHDQNGYRCLCDAGWKLNSPRFEVPMCVVDINECDSIESHCSVEPQVLCQNLDGSYICGPCPVGYTGNGHYCVDVNECDMNNGGCSRSPSVKCHNTIGSHYCDKCPLGYVGDGRVCIRSSNTCENSNLCHPLARCVEYGSGIINCICRDGFTGNGFGGNGCNAVTGGNGCNSSPCLNGGTCISTGPNTYICACPANRIGPDCQRSPGICDSNPCKNGGTCKANHRFPNSTYSCICARGFTGRKCEQNEPQCGGIRNAKSGTIKYPPDGSGNYQSNEICVWLIKTQINKVLNVTFSQFHLEESSECRYDWLQIHDGRTTVARNIGRFCGTQLPLGGNFISTHNLLYLWFRSDNSTSHSGFSLSWDSIDPQCGEVIESNSHGTISSPGSPGNYPINRNCFWYIKAPPGKRLQLHFYTMKIEIHANCSYDFVRVFQGSLPEVGDEDPTTLVHNVPIIAEFCNTTIPGPVTTPTNEVTIYFHSDGVGSDSGFQMHYTVIEGIPGCGGIYTNKKGEFGTPIEGGNYPNGITCEYLIQLPLNSKIKLRFLEVDIETHSNCRFDFVKIYDGDSDQDPIITTLCGQTIPTEIKSSTNKLFLRFKSNWSRQHKGFRAAYEIECGGRFDADSGTVSSPFYPSPYEDDQICNYYIETRLSTAIKLEFTDFDLEAYDSLTIYDGIKSNQTQIGRYSGSSPPPTVHSKTNYLHLEFRSDISIAGQGFKANYSTVDLRCGGVLKTNNGVIRPAEDPNEGGYSHSIRCQWIIIAPIGETIQLQFSSFDLETSWGCHFDYLQVFDNSSDHHVEIGKFCGRVTPPAITSSQNILTLIFQTDSSRNAAGFSATYNFVDTRMMCGGNLFSQSGRIRSPGWPGDYDANKNCQWIIQAPKGQQIILNVLEFSLETHDMCRFDWLEIRNGGSETSPLIGKFCGSQFPNNTIRSFGNKLFLRFVSDISRQGKGFNIEYDSTATGCGGRLTSYQGFVTSPHYPDHYEANTICAWQIIVNAGSSIEMIFTDLDMESLSDCYYDYIEIYDGKDVAGRKLGKFCDSESHPLQIVANSNLAFLRMKSDGSGNGRGFNIKYRAVCTRTITDMYGVIESPNFPNSYPANINCEWKIQGPKSSKIMIDFTHFDLERVSWAPDECTYDFVTIVHYNDEQQELPKKYCDSLPSNDTSLTNLLTIRFKTDVSGNGQGFRLEYKIERCGGLLTKPSGSIISPNYPNHYPKNTLCQWKIEAESDNSIELTIHNLMIEGTRECGLDYLLISPNPVNSTHYLRKICDTLNGAQVITGPRTLYLTFESDSSIAGMGFNATYKFIPLKCGGLFRSANGFIQSPGYPQNYPPNNNCEYLIEVEENHLVELNLMDFNLEGIHSFGYEADEKCPNDRVMIYDGPSRANNLLLIHCGSQLPNKTKYISSENRMLIVLETDRSEQLTGFKFNYTTSCGATIMVNESGQIQIPFGFKMQAENCTWHLKAADETQHITFNIGHISGLESLKATKGASSCKISIEIYDGDNMEMPITKRYCGSYNNLRSITSTGQYLTINVRVLEFSFVWGPKFNFIGFFSTYDTACGGEFNMLNGEIASPEYPLSYPIDVECTWKIIASTGNTMSLLVPDMNILSSDSNCNEDYLEVRNKNEGGELLGVYCGNNPVWNLTSNYGFWIKFRSGTTGVARGFLAQFFYNHHSELTGTEGEITSPLYPEMYHGDSAEHTWRIAVSHKSIISLTFTDFIVDAHSNYCFVKLTIYDGYNKEAPQLGSELCGTEIPETLKSTSNMIFIRLQQNRVLFGTKFMVKWKKIGLETNSELDIVKKYDPKCGNQTIWLTNPQKLINFTSPGWPDGYENSLSCNYVISLNLSNYHTKLTLYQIDLEDSEDCVLDYVQISSSNDLSTWTPLDKKCGTSFNQMLVYEGKPYLKIDFISNYNLNKTGYSGLISLECGNVMGGPSGIISYTSDIFLATRMFYGSNVCMWNITVRVGHTIRYSFNRMNLTSNPPICGSSLIFKNGIDDSSPLLGQGKYCGTTIPEIPMTISNRGFVKLTSQLNDFVDFELKFEEVGVECNDNLQLSHNFNQTIVTTPNYPNIPRPHSKCTWTINVPSGEYIKLDFMEFHLIASVDCQTEYVEIRMGTTKNAPLVNRLCGNKPPKLIVKNNVASVTYYTSSDMPHNGFKMKAQIAPCGAIYEGNNGVIASPNYETDGYVPNMQCEYHVITLPGTYITFTLNYMDWPTQYDYNDDESNCMMKDNIEILTVEPNDVENSNITYKLQSLGVFCIDTIPPPIVTESNEAFIKFTSHGKDDNSYIGWSIQYTASSQKCGSEMSIELGEITSPGYPNNRLNKISCDWYITVPKGRRIKIEIDDLNFAATSIQRLLFYNDHTVTNLIVDITGGHTQRIVYSSDNKLRIKYLNRTPSKYRGFKLTYSSYEPTVCFGELNSMEGIIQQPNNETTFVCEYVRTTGNFYADLPNVGTLALEFTDLKLPARDFKFCFPTASQIIVFTQNNDEIASICENNTITVRLPTPNIKVVSKKNVADPLMEYKLRYKVHKCGGIISSEGDEIIVKLPNFAQNYGKLDCAWQINFGLGEKIMAHIVKFNFKKSCDKEYMAIYQGGTISDPLIKRYCDSFLFELPLVSQTHQLLLEYHSDEYTSESEFEIRFNSSSTACGGFLKHNARILTSPVIALNTTRRYPHNAECIWEIESRTGYHIGLIFTSRFNLEQSDNCINDYVEIFDYIDNDWKSLGRICGRNMSTPFNSTSTRMRVIFRSNNDINGDGFTAKWLEKCGGTFTASDTKRYLESPGYPDKYQPLQTCNYTIIANASQNINIEFIDFQLEETGNDCSYDNVTLYHYNRYGTRSELEMQHTYCGRKTPGIVRINEKLVIEFKTDTLFERPGFRLSYQTESCGGLITEPGKIQTPNLLSDRKYPFRLNCYWNITANGAPNQLKQITITFDMMELEHSQNCQYDYIEIYKGLEFSSDKRVAKLCGNATGHRFNIESNKGIVHFRSDTPNSFHRFIATVSFTEFCNQKIVLNDELPEKAIPFGEYRSYMNCHYSITAPAGTVIKLTFNSFHVAPCAISQNSKKPCTCDYLEVRDGLTPFSDVIDRYCGDTIPEPIVSSLNSLYIIFVTDGQTNSIGFEMKVKKEVSLCGQTYYNLTSNNQSIEIKSPGGDTYPPNLLCRWTIDSIPFRTIELEFMKFDLQEMGDFECSNDMLEITDSTQENYIDEGMGTEFVYSGQKKNINFISFQTGTQHPLYHTEYCGSSIPMNYFSHKNNVEIKFQTDSNIEKSGFTLRARLAHSCERNYTSTQGRIKHEGLDSCTFWIIAPENYTLSLFFIHLYYPETNCTNNGIKIYENGPGGKLVLDQCGYGKPNPIFLTTNQVFIESKVLSRTEEYWKNTLMYDIYYLSQTIDQGPGCGGDIYNYGGFFTSPGYPTNHRNNSDCRWNIIVPVHKVVLKFSEFDMGTPSTCGTNFIEIIETDNEGLETVARTFCGGDMPAIYRGLSYKLSVRLEKTVNFAGTGFQVEFFAAAENAEIGDW